MKLRLEDLYPEGVTAHIEEARAFAAGFAATVDAQPPLDLTTPEGLNAARAGMDLYSFEAPDGTGVPPEDREVAAAGRSARVRILRPAGPTVHAVYLDIHGGGFYLGSAAMGDRRNQRAADRLGVVVVSVDYRLAPEHPWPAGPDDCETAARWLLDHAQAEFGTDRLLIGGGSAGATLAMTTLLRLRDADRHRRFVGANLVYGVYDLSESAPSGRVGADRSRPYREAYLGHVAPAERTRPDISPLYGDLSGLPPALLTVGTRDDLFEDSLALAMRLSAAGSDVELHVYPESPHGFNVFPTAMAAAANDHIEAWLARRLAAG